MKHVIFGLFLLALLSSSCATEKVATVVPTPNPPDFYIELGHGGTPINPDLSYWLEIDGHGNVTYGGDDWAKVFKGNPKLRSKWRS